jgi:hypothetical protein
MEKARDFVILSIDTERIGPGPIQRSLNHVLTNTLIDASSHPASFLCLCYW